MCSATQLKKASVSQEPERVNKSPPAKITARRGTVMCRTGVNICRLGGRCVCQELLNMWKYVRHAGEDGTDGAYREGRHPPAQRWGCGAYPKAFSPSTCCWHLAHLSPDGHRQKSNPRQIIWTINKPKTGKHTVIMMQGESFVQKPSSRSLWNVASFSTMRTNFADETISGRESRKMHARPSQTCKKWAKDTPDSTNIWGDCNSLTGVTVDPCAIFLRIAQITWDEPFGCGQLVKKAVHHQLYALGNQLKLKKKKTTGLIRNHKCTPTTCKALRGTFSKQEMSSTILSTDFWEPNSWVLP